MSKLGGSNKKNSVFLEQLYISKTFKGNDYDLKFLLLKVDFSKEKIFEQTEFDTYEAGEEVAEELSRVDWESNPTNANRNKPEKYRWTPENWNEDTKKSGVTYMTFQTGLSHNYILTTVPTTKRMKLSNA